MKISSALLLSFALALPFALSACGSAAGGADAGADLSVAAGGGDAGADLSGAPKIIVGSGAPAPAGNIPTNLILAGAGVPDPGYAGYIITGNAGVFRITWTGTQSFRGSVFGPLLGRLSSGCQDGSCALASNEDVVQVNAKDATRIDFYSVPASGKRSGFDIEVPGNQLTVDLFINDARDATHVEFVSAPTKQVSTASDMPVSLVISN